MLDLAARLEDLSGWNLIAGRRTPPSAGAVFDVVSPATGARLGCAPLSEAPDLESAVAAAEKAGAAWAEVPALERSRLLLEAAAAVEAQSEALARVISAETGRPIRTETRPEVANAVRIFRYFAGLASEAKGESVPFTKDVIALSLREPLGVVAAIVPWNVPAMLTCLKIAPALATGNAVIVKPAEESPLSTAWLCEMIAAALPPGVLNVLQGRGETVGAGLVAHPRIAKVAFTGSTSTGRLIARTAADRLIPVTLELGGKSPLLIFGDADLERAVSLTDLGMRFSRQGQSCTSTTRIYIHQDLRAAYLERLCAHIDSLVIGDPLDEATDIGTLISHAAVDRVSAAVAAAERAGLVVRRAGALPTAAPFATGAYLQPTLVLDPPHAAAINQEEIFGPVATVSAWDDFDALIESANGTDFGLSASLVTNDLKAAMRAARKIKAGFIQVNTGLVIQPGISFGGYKSSGLGREASLGSMLESYTQVKSILIDHS